LKMAAATLTAIIILGLAILSGSAQAGPGPGEYRISLGENHIAVSLTATLDQNISISAIPQFSFILQGENSSSVSTAITNSIRQKTPNATLTDLLLVARSNGSQVVVTLSFKVLGAASSDQWGYTRADIAWRSFKVEDDLQVNGTAFNLVGKHYLSDPLLSAVNSFFSLPSRFRPVFRLDGESATPLEVQTLAPNLNLLDFSALSTSLDSWSSQFSLSAHSTTYTRQVGFDILVRTPDPEAPGEAFFDQKVYYKVDSVLEAPGTPDLTGDTVFYGEGVLEQIMGTVIGAVLLVAVGTYLADRRLRTSQRFKRRK